MDAREICYDAGCYYQSNAVGHVFDAAGRATRISVSACGRCESCLRGGITTPQDAVDEWDYGRELAPGRVYVAPRRPATAEEIAERSAVLGWG